MNFNKCYEFDPCSIDGSDVEEEEEALSIDNWKPRQKDPHAIIQSHWRKEQIGTNFNQEPGVDDLKKIKMFLKKSKADHEIMRTFGINAETLMAIKKDKYCPVDGISLDNLSKIYNEFRILDKRIDEIKYNFQFLKDVLNINDKDIKEFHKQKNKEKREQKKKKQELEELLKDDE